MKRTHTLGVIGGGKIGEAILVGLRARRPEGIGTIRATVFHAARAAELSKRLGIEVGIDNRALARACDIVLLAVKPQTIREVLREIAPDIGPRRLVVTVAAGVTTALVEKTLKKRVPVVRVMPNMAIQVFEGMSVIAPGARASAEDVARVEAIFGAIGRTHVTEERHLDAATGLSGSGPAFMMVAIESMAEGGVKVGLPREVATLLAAQATLGAAKLVLETGEHPAKLKDLVTTPAGTTIDGLLEIEDGGLRVTLIKAVVRSTERARELIR